MLELLGTVMPLVDKLVARIPDPAARERAALEMQKELIQAAVSESQAQAKINEAEAANQHLFVAGWRPAIGWACAIGFGWTFVGYPLLSWVIALFGMTASLPSINSDILMELTFGMLGMGALRSFDKWKLASKK